jgi:peptidoglycan/xylan/chitin deacetylase (PgdA/CDA1 family)
MKKSLRLLLATVTICLSLTVAASAQQTKLIALTFDDGPSNTCSPQVLDILKEKHAKATFFLIGKYLDGHHEVIQREVAEGHQIANHTYQHKRMTQLTDEEIKDGIAKTDEKLTEITGLTNFMVRTPFGARNARVAAATDAPIILWSVDAASGKQLWSGQLVKNIMAKASDGGIILLHDTTQANVNAVGPVIDKLRAQGYEFVTVQELFRLRGMTPQNHQMYKSVVNSDPQGFNEKNIKTHWAYSAIRDLSANGCMSGDRTGWHPNRYLTRAQAVTALWRACGKPVSAAKHSFSDVPLNSYYAAAAAWAKQNGIVRGERGGKFAPNNKVTREQLYVMLSGTAATQEKSAASVETPVSYIDDDRIDSWALSSVEKVRKMGFSSKNDVEIFRPRDWATRAEVAEMLNWYQSLK